MIVCGESLTVLSAMQSESVHMCVTSPPYWGLRAYQGDEGMIGLEPTLEEHIERLVEVFRQVRRVLRKDGTLWLNYGDCYAGGSSRQSTAPDSLQAKYQGGQNRKGASEFNLKPKDLMLMPARVALALQADGWYLRSEIIWHKPNPMPESVTDRPTSAHEKVFLFSQSGSPTFWVHEDGRGSRQKPEPDYKWINRNTSQVSYAEPRILCGEWRRVNRWRGRDYFYDAEAVRTPSNGWNGKAQPTHAPEHQGNQGHPQGERAVSNLRNVWKIATAPYSGAHFATFPPAFVEPCIKAGTSQKGVCAECGAPWVRQVERSASNGTSRAGGFENLDRNDFEKVRMGDAVRAKTLGWHPSCTCQQSNGDPCPTKPAVVLDCFGGAGTVALVAQRLGRRSICIEISPEYAQMAYDRCNQDLPVTRRSMPAGYDPDNFQLEFLPE